MQIRNLQLVKSLSRDGLYLLVGAMFIFAAGWYAERRVERYVEGQVRVVVDKAMKRFGLPIQIGGREVHFGSLALIDISMGDGQPVIIDRIDIGLSWNPFSPSFLRPGRINIGRVFVKEQVRREDRLKRIQKWREIFTKKPNSSDSKVASSGLIPPEIRVFAAKVILADGADEHSVASGVSLNLLVPQRRLQWEAEQLNIEPWIKENFLSGRVNLSEAGDLQWMIRRRPNWIGKAEWMISCETKKPKGDLVCDMDADQLPQSILRPFQKYLVETKNPGFHGSMRAAKFDNGMIQASIDADVTNIVAQHKAISIDPIGPFSVGNQFVFTYDPKSKHLTGKQMKFAFAPDVPNERSVGIWLDADLTKDQGHGFAGLSGNVHITLPRTRCDDVLNAVPPGFAPDLQGFSLTGDISLEAFVRLDHGDIGFHWGKNLMECQVAKVPPSYTSEYLLGPFELERTVQDGTLVRIPVDPARPEYARLRDIPPIVVAAFVTSEDAGFWLHHGVEPAAIVQALERNAREGRAAVGGSTITMQTVKNLFLSRDKNISRKAQEIFLAWHLDQSVGKQRILEIYLNIVEFGPGLYGIGAASQKFFGIKPSQLTLKQGIYLASLLPAPIPRYMYYCRGSVTENYSNLVHVLLQRMLSLGRITSEAYGAAESEPIRFQDAQGDGRCKRRDSVNEDISVSTEQSGD